MYFELLSRHVQAPQNIDSRSKNYNINNFEVNLARNLRPEIKLALPENPRPIIAYSILSDV